MKVSFKARGSSSAKRIAGDQVVEREQRTAPMQ
jgi:hypothetical protein